VAAQGPLYRTLYPAVQHTNNRTRENGVSSSTCFIPKIPNVIRRNFVLGVRIKICGHKLIPIHTAAI